MRLLNEPGRTEIQQSRANVLAFPIFLGVVILAVAVRQFIPPHPSPVVLAVCAVAIALDAVFARWLQRRGGATLVVTAETATVTPAGAAKSGATPQILTPTSGGTLSFRLQENGMVGTQMQYTLKLRDDTSGREVSVTEFGRHKVREACELQGWHFS